MNWKGLFKINGLAAALLVFFGCSDVKNSPEFRKVLMDRDSAMEILEDREKEIEEFAKEFDQIEKNLSAIDSSKARLLFMNTQPKMSQKDRIHTLIANIYIALDENQASIKKLEARLKKSQALQVAIKSMRKTLEAKEKEIARLEKELNNLQIEVKNLQDAVRFKEKQLAEKDTLLAKKDEKIQTQEKLIGDKETELNKVYFIKGTSKELQAAGIIKKEGGILGMGSVKLLSDKLGKDKIKTLHLKNDKILPLGPVRKKKIITPHPSDSYFFVARDGQYYLKISYPDKFWSLSRYLVVVVD